eukprot:TRINITY_DN1411_c0_g1_i1.p1 TRINITY_DN1411_c0_g1~~TRINITY_DN1411_c0_g1_i1.p1  ORF type:complete len:566 (+),score=101.90 TRINITY_DN1411_c0_g1_i1:162-1700(+)
MALYVHRGETLEIPKSYAFKDLDLEINWELLNSAGPKIDVTCTLFDDQRSVRETISLFQPNSSDESGVGAVVHGGKEEEQEGDAAGDRISLNLNNLSSSIRALMFCVVASTSDFSSVDAADVALKTAEGMPLITFSLGCQGKHSALLLCALYKGMDNIWFFTNIGDATGAKHVKDVEPLMLKHLRQLTINKSGDVFNLNKGDIVDVPDVEQMVIGFGWRSAGDLSCQASVMLFDNHGRNFDDVYYLNKTSQDQSVQYLGELDGSKDQVHFGITLPRVYRSVNVLVGTLTIYSVSDAVISSSATHVISDVYCRFINTTTKKEICRYEVQSFGRENSQITFKIFRKSPYDPNKWKIMALGYPTPGDSVVDLIPVVQDNFVDRWDLMFKWTQTEITVVSATGLRAMSGEKGLSNTFAKIIVDRREKLVLTTPVEKKTVNPTWDFCFQTDALNQVEIEVYHKGFSEKFLGRVVVDLQSLPLEVDNDVFLNLYGRGKNAKKDAKITGTIHLKVVKKK